MSFLLHYQFSSSKSLKLYYDGVTGLSPILRLMFVKFVGRFSFIFRLINFDLIIPNVISQYCHFNLITSIFKGKITENSQNKLNIIVIVIVHVFPLQWALGTNCLLHSECSLYACFTCYETCKVSLVLKSVH